MCEETKQASEQDSDVIQILELSHKEFKIPMTNMLSWKMQTTDKKRWVMQAEMETLRIINARNQQNCNRNEERLCRLIGRLDTAKERISAFENMSIETSQTEM